MDKSEHTSLAAWRRTWNGLGATKIDEILFEDLLARYREPHRHYHTLQHLDECFERLQSIRLSARHPEEVEVALWFHDAIYDVARGDNEARSADWARAALHAAGLPAEVAERVHALVIVTRHNALPAAIDQQILVDVDLSILGAPLERFEEYEWQIRAEYSAIPLPQFRAARRRVLAEFLQRPTIFNTQVFIDRYEHQARANLARSLAKLSYGEQK